MTGAPPPRTAAATSSIPCQWNQRQLGGNESPTPTPCTNNNSISEQCNRDVGGRNNLPECPIFPPLRYNGSSGKISLQKMASQESGRLFFRYFHAAGPQPPIGYLPSHLSGFFPFRSLCYNKLRMKSKRSERAAIFRQVREGEARGECVKSIPFVLSSFDA